MISGKKILILGAGKEGISAANFLGKRNEIFLTDEKPEEKLKENLSKINANFTFFTPSQIEKGRTFDLAIRSPGINLEHNLVLQAKKSGAEISSGTDLFFEYCPAQIIGITGTKGKGTTATLIFEMLKADGADAFLAGNIGTPALDILHKLKKESICVLELSSFQLEDVTDSPHIAVVLMITSEHLNWHKTHKDYVRAKEFIVKFQTKNDFAVINADFPNSRAFSRLTQAKVFFVSTEKRSNGVYIENGTVVSEIPAREEIIKTSKILLPGAHNLQNVAAAVAAAKIAGVKTASVVKILASFRGLEHRLEFVRELNGVEFYNDSFSTTPETAIAAIKAFSNPKILIVGGSSKKSDFLSLAQTIAKDKTIKTLIAIGEEGPRIARLISKTGSFKGNIIKGLPDMESVVKIAYKESKRGDIVLLSPACASFDMFKNYQDRGEKFKAEINKLK